MFFIRYLTKNYILWDIEKICIITITKVEDRGGDFRLLADSDM
jgi:hypothetical protein